MRDKLETAKGLAKAHFEMERRLTRVNLVHPFNDNDPHEPIKLLEVVEGTLERGIEPIRFSADPKRGIDYPCIIIEVSPDEYDAIQSGKLGFGNRNWTVGEELPRA